MKKDSGKPRIRIFGSIAIHGDACRSLADAIPDRSHPACDSAAGQQAARTRHFPFLESARRTRHANAVKFHVAQGARPAVNAKGIAREIFQSQSKRIDEWLNVRSSSLSMKSGRWIIRASPDGLQ